jgi:hypothetical protein
MDIAIKGTSELRGLLAGLAGKDTNRVVAQALKDAAKPLLERSKTLTPVRTGRLRASLGIATSTNRREGLISVHIGPRRDFTFTTAAGSRRAVASSAKRREKARAAGRTIDTVRPGLYAYFIEFGRTLDGKRIRRKGGAHMLKTAYDEERQGILTRLAETVRNRIRALRRK